MNKFSTSALKNRTYKDIATGKTYEIQFQVHFVQVNPENPKDPNYAAYNATKNAKSGTNGNNIIEAKIPGDQELKKDSEGKHTVSNSGHPAISDLYDYNLVKTDASAELVKRAIGNTTGNLAYINVEDLREGATVVHETFHLFGFGDRYIKVVDYYYTTKINGRLVTKVVSKPSWHKGFAEDLMNNNSLKVFNQTHIDDLAKAALVKQEATKTNEFVVGQKVDDATNEQPARAEPKPNPTLTIVPGQRGN